MQSGFEMRSPPTAHIPTQRDAEHVSIVPVSTGAGLKRSGFEVVRHTNQSDNLRKWEKERDAIRAELKHKEKALDEQDAEVKFQRARNRQWHATADTYREQVSFLKGENALLQQDNKMLQGRLNEIYGSKSWRLTGILRRLRRKLSLR